MSPPSKTLRVGTRRSALATSQTRFVVDQLAALHQDLNIEVVEVVTTGDKVLNTSLNLVPGKGLFVKEIEEKLLADEIDLAVHSMKDLPTEIPEGLMIGAIPARHDPRDVLVTRVKHNLEDLPEGARVGTGSLRRKAQLLQIRPDLEVAEIRGNIDTRLRKSETEDFDGIILAAAGLFRMGWEERIQQYLGCEIMIPAVGQGALGIEVRTDDSETQALLSPLNDPTTEIAVRAERRFLHEMGGGCRTPMAAFCRLHNGRAVVQAFCADENGHEFRRAKKEGTVDQAVELASGLARYFLKSSPGRTN